MTASGAHETVTRQHLAAVLAAGPSGADAADRLCVACLPMLQVSAAAISLIDQGVSRGTYGASSATARVLDELQFTHGEGPCLAASRSNGPILIADLESPRELRWPMFSEAAARAGVRAVFALPIRVGSLGIGALDLFRSKPGRLTVQQFYDAQAVAEAASVTLLDMFAPDDVGLELDASAEAPTQLDDRTGWARIEVYQATGMIMAQLDVSPDDALARLRGYAFAHALSASEVARLVVSRRLRLES